VRVLGAPWDVYLAGAVPVAAPSTCEEFRDGVNDVGGARTPEPFQAVGAWYEDFSQTTDDEVRDLLARAAVESGRWTDLPSIEGDLRWPDGSSDEAT